MRIGKWGARGASLLAIVTAGLGFAAPASAQLWGFDSGTLDGWTATGSAFASQPTYGNNVEPRRPGESPGQSGNYWIGTFEDRPSPAIPAGRVQGDAPQGSLTSPMFTVSRPTIDFLIGGGRDLDRERISLLVKTRRGDPPPGRPGMLVSLPDGEYLIARSATGADEEHMHRVSWNVSHLSGREARLMIVDAASEPWGHINIDDIHGAGLGTPPRPPGLGTAVPVGSGPLGTAVPVASLGTAVPVAPRGVVVAQPVGGPVVAYPVGGPVTAYPVGGGPVVVTPAPSGPVTAYPVGGGPVIVQAPAPGGGATGDPGIPHVLRPDPGMPPGAGPSGHFQLIALEFVSLHESRDDMLQSDGPGDEIMVTSDNLTFGLDGHFVEAGRTRSGIIGANGMADFVGGRGVAGFSVRGDERGGIITGDIYPPRPRPVRTNGDLPMVLWDGVLSRGGNGVVIVPSLWEMDSRSVSPAQLAWDAGMVRARTLGLSAARAFSDPVEDRASPIDTRLIGPIGVFDDGNRPIGAAVHHGGFPLPGQPIAHDVGMTPPSIALTYDRAMLFAARPATAIELRPEPGVAVFDGLPVPRGGIVMELVDPPGNDGDYYLVMQLVQLP